jgi:hypothetical protein
VRLGRKAPEVDIDATRMLQGIENTARERTPAGVLILRSVQPTARRIAERHNQAPRAARRARRAALATLDDLHLNENVVKIIYHKSSITHKSWAGAPLAAFAF